MNNSNIAGNGNTPDSGGLSQEQDQKRVMIIDRFEGGFAVCEYEDGSGSTAHVNIPEDQIDCRAAEGSVIVYDAERRRYFPDADATKNRADTIQKLMNSLRRRKKQTDNQTDS